MLPCLLQLAWCCEISCFQPVGKSGASGLPEIQMVNFAGPVKMPTLMKTTQTRNGPSRPARLKLNLIRIRKAASMISQFIYRPRSSDERIALSYSVLANSYTQVYQSTGLVSHVKSIVVHKSGNPYITAADYWAAMDILYGLT